MRARVPGSSANLGPAFDALGLALTLYLEASTQGDGDGPPAPEDHPAVEAYRSAGGQGALFVSSDIPPARGLGYSGAARVAGLLLAGGPDPLGAATLLEGHPDNAAASLLGGVVAVAGGHAVRVPLGLEPGVVAWVPEGHTSTDESRSVLPAVVPFDDAVFNVGRTALLVAALAAGDTAALRTATEDRLHQLQRTASLPDVRAALQGALDAGAWAAWLSGSGPAVVALCDPAAAPALAAALPGSGQTLTLAVDTTGATLTP